MNVQFQILKDNRKLSFCVYGKVSGEPVFYFHGFPGSHLEARLTGLEKAASKMNLQLIAINRPGYSNSDFQQNRKLLDWPDDVCELADLLGIEKFSVLGYSGGGPYALACVSKIPERLKNVIVVSGMGPANAPGFKKVPSWMLVKWPGFILNLILGGMKKTVEKDPDKFHSSMNKSLPKVDLDALNEKNLKEDFVMVIKEAFKSGINGAKQDAKIYKHNWGFELKEVKHQVHLWHGKEDANVKIETAKFVASRLPNCNTRFLDNEGHLSLISNYAEKILETIINQRNQ